MAVVNDCPESFVFTNECDMKKNRESSDASTLPSGESVNNTQEAVALNSREDVPEYGEPCEKKKKTRRGKCKRKNPYSISKDASDLRKSVDRPKTRPSPRFAHRHADAPYNTNEFLMEDHNAFVQINSPPTAPPNIGIVRPPRIRDNSFTSVESDEDHFYSSPEDEEEFLTKEFSNTYQDLHVETLQGMSKSELIQQVVQLEEKIDGLENRFVSRKMDKDQFDKLINSADCEKVGVPMDLVKQFQIEIGRLRLENEKLQIENDRLRRRNRSSSVSSVDSESDSTTSSPSSVSDLSDKNELIESNNDDMDSSRGKVVLSDESITDVGMEEEKNEPV